MALRGVYDHILCTNVSEFPSAARYILLQVHVTGLQEWVRSLSKSNEKLANGSVYK